MKNSPRYVDISDSAPASNVPNDMRGICKTLGLKGVYAKCAIDAFRSADKSNWKSALHASRIVGKYDRGATLGLSEDAGVSPDTIEDRAHAYMMFERLCNLNNGQFRLFVFQARRLPYVYINHFRSLYDQQDARGLTDGQVLDLLMDIVQAEGSLSTRKLDAHISARYGELKNWEYYAGRALKEIDKTLNHPNLPKKLKKRLAKLYSWLGDNA